MRNPQHVVLASLIAFSLILNLAYVLTADKKGKASADAGGYSQRLEQAKDLPPKIVLQFIDDNEVGENFGVITNGNKRLTYNEKGSTNNARILIDGNDFLLAKPKELSHTPALTAIGVESGRAIREFSRENLGVIKLVQEVDLTLWPIPKKKNISSLIPDQFIELLYLLVDLKEIPNKSDGVRMAIHEFLQYEHEYLALSEDFESWNFMNEQ